MIPRGNVICRQISRLHDIEEHDIADELNRVRIRNSHYNSFEAELAYLVKQPKVWCSL